MQPLTVNSMWFRGLQGTENGVIYSLPSCLRAAAGSPDHGDVELGWIQILGECEAAPSRAQDNHPRLLKTTTGAVQPDTNNVDRTA